jgi:hypothetical protein
MVTKIQQNQHSFVSHTPDTSCNKLRQGFPKTNKRILTVSHFVLPPYIVQKNVSSQLYSLGCPIKLYKSKS